MSINIKKRLLCIALVLIIVSTVTAVSVAVFAEDTAVIPESAYIGETYKIPSTVEVDGNQLSVSARVIAPSGKTYAATRLSVSEIGRYTVEYINDGKVVKTQYCVCVRRPTDLVSTNSFATVEGIADYKYYDSKALSGVKVQVQKGATITVEREIDMTNCTKNDILASVVIEPTVQGSRDFGGMNLTFTDVEDPSVYFTVITTCGNQDTRGEPGRAYIRAGGNGQLAGGYEEKSGSFVWNTTDIYGARAPFSFQADVLGNASNFDFALKLCYDSDENALYIANGEGSLFGKPYRIVDFDEVANFGTNIWTGFPSGRARLTITFDRFVEESGSVIINQVGGIDFSQENLPDTEAPQITVDLNGEHSVPNSYVGATYNVFNATAWDFYDLETSVTSRVYYKTADGLIDVAVRNGSFVTDKVGEYVIEYVSQDKSGNIATEQVSLFCVSKPNQINFGDIENISGVKIFDKVTLADPSDVRCNGGNGNLTKTLEVYSPSNKVVELTENSFVPDETGTYVARYTATDFFGHSATKEIQIEVVSVDKPVLVGEISLPEVFIKNFTYDFPAVAAKICNGNEVSDATVKYLIAGQEVVNGTFTVSGDAETVEAECLAYDGTEFVSLAKKTIPVIDGDGGKSQQKYFYNSDGSINPTLEQNSVALNVGSDGEVFFANKLSYGTFEAKFSYVTGTIGFSNAKIKLSSADDKTKTVTFTIGFSSMGLTISAKGMSAIDFATKTDVQNTAFALKFDSETNRIADIFNDEFYVLNTFDDGTQFNGFGSGIYMTISFSAVKVASTLNVTALNNQSFGYKYVQIDDNGETVLDDNGKPIPDPAGDTVAPQIVINGIYDRRLNLGDTLTVYTAQAFDVLNQVSSLTLTVYDPDNNAVLSGVSTDKEYTVKMDKIGNYRVIYTAKDTSGNGKTTKGGTSITVVDNVAPVLEVELNFKEVYRVGSKITLPKFTVSDNTENVYCDVYLQLPSGETRLLVHYANGETTSYLSAKDATYPKSFKAGNNAFVAETAGKYVVSYVAYDDSFNYVRYTAEFTVVE